MLSIGVPTSAEHAESYFSQPNYYTNKGGDTLSSRWAGKGAEKLGIAGQEIEKTLSAGGPVNVATSLGTKVSSAAALGEGSIALAMAVAIGVRPLFDGIGVLPKVCGCRSTSTTGSSVDSLVGTRLFKGVPFSNL